VLRGERLAAAREGARIKSALERALRLDPSLTDAQFGIGLYHYYADVAPVAAKILRWLMLLPGGDRVKGLQEMQSAREHGSLVRGEADFQLHLIYLWYEKKPDQALALLRGLDRRYPTNALFLQRIAEVQSEYFHDRRASAASWQDLLERAQQGRVHSARIAEVRARLGLASDLAAMNRRQDAIEQLKRVIEMRPTAPSGARERAEMQLRALTRSSF
jgi:tetratricopeptide (TPR) repeat protein